MGYADAARVRADPAVGEATTDDVIASREIHPDVATRLRGLAPWAIVSGFALILAFALARHEMWRDELQSWAIARDSSSLADLLHNIRYEGHPVLWYALLAPLAALRDGATTMQIAQWVIAVASMAIVVWRAPFSLGQKAMFACAYFPLFEFGVMSRSYGLGLLLSVSICALAARSRPRPWPAIGVLVALLSLTSAFGAILAFAFLMALGLDEVLAARAGLPRPRAEVLGGSAAFACAGLLYAYGQTVPPGDAVYTGWYTRMDWGLGASAVGASFRAIAPIPRFQRHFWQTHALDGGTWLMALLAIGLVGAFAWSMRRRPGAVALLLVGTAATTAFMYGKLRYAVAPRHYGHIFVALLAAMWLAPTMAAWRSDRSGAPGGPATESDTDGGAERAGSVELRQALFTFALAIQVVAGLIALTIDAGSPFSNAERAAEFLRREHLDEGVVIGYPTPPASAIAAELDRPILYAESNRLGTYVLYDRANGRPLPPLQAIVDGFESVGVPALVLVSTEIDTSALRHVELLARFDDQIVVDEGFTVYRVVPDRGTSQRADPQGDNGNRVIVSPTARRGR